MKKPVNKIEKLIAEMCPDGVEFKVLGEVGKLIGGSGLPKADFTESGVGCIHYGQIYTYYGIHTNQTISFVSEESATKLKRVKHGDIIIAKTSEEFWGQHTYFSKKSVNNMYTVPGMLRNIWSTLTNEPLS
jgi:hypothetical protein